MLSTPESLETIVSDERETPLVAVVTPVHNGEPFLAECIESVLSQTYSHFEYIVFDDASTDGSAGIALEYARKDPRVRVERSAAFLGVMESHNAVFRLISTTARYCKVVSYEDLLFPECLESMVALAETNRSVGFIGSYQLVGSQVRWQGFDYPRSVIPGPELARQIFLGFTPGLGLGTPTSVLYRADLVRTSEEFYPGSEPHSDASAILKYLQRSDYGFVYQVLSYGRIHPELESLKSQQLNRFAAANLRDLIQYGPTFLSKSEHERLLHNQLTDYYGFLAVNILRRRGNEFWDYHKRALEVLGHPLSTSDLLRGAAMKVTRALSGKLWKCFSFASSP